MTEKQQVCAAVFGGILLAAVIVGAFWAAVAMFGAKGFIGLIVFGILCLLCIGAIASAMED